MSPLDTAQDASVEIYLIYCSCPNSDVAEQIARALVSDRLAACVHCLPSGLSVYRWQGQVEEAHECILLIKAPAATYTLIEARICELHPYELPEIIAVPLHAGLPEYLAWIKEASSGTA